VTTHYPQGARNALLAGDIGKTRYLRKKARIVAVEMNEYFTVDTDRGMMNGSPGDFLVTNDPRDDAGSDLWTISRERLEATYEDDTE